MVLLSPQTTLVAITALVPPHLSAWRWKSSKQTKTFQTRRGPLWSAWHLQAIRFRYLGAGKRGRYCQASTRARLEMPPALGCWKRRLMARP